ncbi:MAG: hypothetical protein KKH28_08800, partial [Elusimicrobia bacterium]|nr:hypothetical protein [Elusimicrobiota bacterium]
MKFLTNFKIVFKFFFPSTLYPLPSTLVLLFLATAARAVEITGGDWHGADLNPFDYVTIPSDYATLRGTFTNVGTFTINSGTTVFVAQGAPLVIYASTVTINGKLDATGRGLPGGIGGDYFLPGAAGFGAGPGGIGGGNGGAPEKGGGGGGHADADLDGVSGGAGAGSPGTGGLEYSSTATISAPLSPDDISMGSGGGGGGGGNGVGEMVSGTGGAGGGSIYIEALYITITGTVTVRGLNGGSGINLDTCDGKPGGGGGGSGGSILIKSLETLAMDNSYVASDGGSGGYAICNGAGTTNPGGGGAAGRVMIIYRAPFAQTVISTSAGPGGIAFPTANYGVDGSFGTVSYGIVPSSPAGFAVQQVFKTSAAYSWDPKNNQQWGGVVSYLPAPATYQFRLYESTPALPLDAYYKDIYVSSAAISLPETGLTPNTTIYRMLTAYTDFGDSAPSAMITTVTFAAPPAGAWFPSASSASLSFAWSSGTVSQGFNPAYTDYEVSRSSVPGFAAAVSAAFTIGLSSAPAGLEPNTTYYFSVKALGINGVYTSSTPVLSTPTLAAAPVSPSFDGVYTASITFSWSGA